MDDFLKEALEIVKAQASQQVMTTEQIADMVSKLSTNLRALSTGDVAPSAEAPEALNLDPKKSIKEKSVVCLVGQNVTVGQIENSFLLT